MASRNDDIELLRYAAQQLGWTERERSRGGWTLFAPPPQVAKIVLPAVGPLRQSVRASWTRKLMRYADPLKAAAFLAAVDNGAGMGIDWRGKFAPVPPAPEPKKSKETKEEPKEQGAVSEQQVQRVEALIEQAHDPGEPIVRPWMAHHSPSAGGGSRYESQAVLERKWPDGHIDYVCAWPGCDYNRDNPRSVATHYGRSFSHRVSAGKDKGYVRDPEYVEPMSRREIDRLARWRKRLTKALADLDPTAEDFVDRLAERLVGQMGELSEGSGEPLTAEETLERVRRLVDSGAYLAAQMAQDELSERVRDLEASLLQAQAEASEAAARAARAVDRWNSLRELVDQEVV